MPSIRSSFSLFVLILVVALGTYSAFRLKIHENLDNAIPTNVSMNQLQPILEKGNRSLVFSLNIRPMGGDLERIDSAAQALRTELSSRFEGQIDSLAYRSDIDPEEFSGFISEHLYLFLEERDYATLDSLVSEAAIHTRMAENKLLLSGAQGFGRSQMIIRDPLQLSHLAYKNLNRGLNLGHLQSSAGLFLTSDRSKILLQGHLSPTSKDVVNSQALVDELEQFKEQWNRDPQNPTLDFFGTFLIVDANASQIKQDILLTANLALIFIVGLLYFYYRRISTILFFVLPGLFGICASLTIIHFIYGGISALALSASAVIMGIVVDYSFHFFAHLNQEKDPVKTRNSIAFPLAISSLTTVVAFFALTFASSTALRDFGRFTGLSLIFTLVFILFFLPYILRFFGGKSVRNSSPSLDRLIQRMGEDRVKIPRWSYVLILTVTGALAFFGRNVGFEEDLHQINFYPETLKQREIQHQNINPDTQKRITLVATADSPDSVASINRQLYQRLLPLADESVLEINSLAPFVLPEYEIRHKRDLWEKFWAERIHDFQSDFATASDALGFRSGAFSGYLSDLDGASSVGSYELVERYRAFGNLIIPGHQTSLITTLVIPKDERKKVESIATQVPGVLIVDGESVASSLVELVKQDFNFLLLLASATVFLTMLLIYGRIELTLISFLPMALSWIWILGLAALFGLKFNFINIMIATIIFGLGDDFAIFITDGLQARYRSGKEALSTHKAGILLSSLSTIIGTGVLFFGQHPAIRSIAGVSVIGISTIALLSFVVQPFLYRLLITRRTDQGEPPYVALELIMSVYAFSLFFIGCMLTTLVTLLVFWIPFWKKKGKKLVIQRLIRFFTALLIKSMFILRKRRIGFENLDFTRPSILIANHSSFLDILCMAMLHPKLTFLVGPWVYNSPIFGRFIRFADYIPAFEPVEQNTDKLRQLVADGYSILIFPESHRSVDGQLSRFHKGAFYLSELLQIDITPVLLHGMHYALPKGEFYVKRTAISMKVLPRIRPDDASFGEGYRDRAKAITRYFKSEHATLSREMEDGDYLKMPIRYAYLYKGPVLEWYFSIKYRFEKANFALIDSQLEGFKRIYDLGCGYGFLSYFLQLRDPSRTITGVDYDEEKVQVAQHAYLRSPQTQFVYDNIVETNLTDAEVVILLDVLHYLNGEQKLTLLEKCLPCLQKGGKLILKDAFKSDSEKHEWTLKSERWSTKLLGFNKAEVHLDFIDRAFIDHWVESHGLSLEILAVSEKSSNHLMLISKSSRAVATESVNS